MWTGTSVPSSKDTEVIDVTPDDARAVAVRPESHALESWDGASARGLRARREREAIVAQVLKAGPDFGVIPGTDKPSLLKPGAEKIIDALNLWPDYEPLTTVEDYEKPLFAYRYRCVLRSRGANDAIASGIGSCNSMESKYRWRGIPEWVVTSEEKARAVDTKTRKKRNGGTFLVYLLPNDDIFSQVNTLDKMAQKRSLIAAVLDLGFSEQFTQDVEDYANGDEPQRAQRRSAQQQEQPQAPDALAEVKQKIAAELEHFRTEDRDAAIDAASHFVKDGKDYSIASVEAMMRMRKNERWLQATLGNLRAEVERRTAIAAGAGEQDELL